MSDQSKRLEWWIHNHLGSDFCGSPCPPNDGQAIYFDAEDGYKRISKILPEHGDEVKVASWGNDGFDLLIGWPHKWNETMPRQVAHRLALWILWRWAWGEWFGLRRKLWYWALHRIVDRRKTSMPQRLKPLPEKVIDWSSKASSAPPASGRTGPGA